MSEEPAVKVPRFVFFLLLLASILPYLNILNNGLFLDDLDYIVNNAYIRDWRYLPKMFTENLIAGCGKDSDYYRPAIQVACGAVYSLWGLNPMGYHLLSVIFHAACVWLLFQIFFALLGSWEVPLAAALIFAVHPALTESVASASALGVVMGTAFMLLAIWLHIKIRTNHTPLRYAAALLSTACALLSKETMVIIPGGIFLAEFCFLSELTGLKARFKNALLRSLPYLAVSLFYIVLRFTVLNFGGTGNLYRGSSNILTENMAVRVYTFMSVFWEFIKITFWPQDLHMERMSSMPVYASPFAWPVIAGFLLFAGMAAVVLWCGRERRTDCAVPAFGLAWFIFGFVPVSNIFIPISTTMVESWIYTPLAGIALIFAYFLRKGSGKLFWWILPIFVLPLLVRTVIQNRVWRDAVSFYEHTLRYAPESGRFRNNLAMAYAEQKRYNDAIEQYRIAISIGDVYPETHHNLANVYRDAGRFADAEKEYWRAVEMAPKFFHSYVSLALMYADLKKMDAAVAVLERLIGAAPERWEGYFQLGAFYYESGMKEKARALWSQALAADPYNRLVQEALKKP